MLANGLKGLLAIASSPVLIGLKDYGATQHQVRSFCIAQI
jgi:hypothetical protein